MNVSVARQEVAPIPAIAGAIRPGVARVSTGLNPQPFWMSMKPEQQSDTR